VDILVTVLTPHDAAAFGPALSRAGDELRGREPGHRMFGTPQGDVQVHVWAGDDLEIRRYLAPRERLRTSSEDRAAYERLSRERASRAWEDMNHYSRQRAS
jgi:GrpB-like predicted nucleotidyltransferase (UPF0157 family)